MHFFYQTVLVALSLSSTPHQVFSSTIPESKSPRLPCPDTSYPTTHLYQPQSRPWIAPRAFILPPRVEIPDPVVPVDPSYAVESAKPMFPPSEPIYWRPDTTQDPQEPDGVRPTGQPDPTASAPKPTGTGEKETPEAPDLGGSSSTSFVIGPSPTATATNQIGRSNDTQSSGQGGLDPGQVYSSASSWHQRQGLLYWVLIVSTMVGVLCI